MINFLKACQGLYGDKEIIITACGPSLNKYKEEIIEKSQSHKVILICIKQSYNLFKQLCDFHIINTSNSQKYEYLRKIHPFKFNKTKPTVILGTSDKNNTIFMDYHYIYETQHGGVNQLISSQKNLKNFHLNLEDYKDNLLIRDWGPGIMYEFVLPFALLLGSKKIITYGWDIADKNNQNTHFDEINLKKFFEKRFEKFIFDEEYYSDRRRHNAWNYFLHKYKFTYNKAKMFDGEASIVKSFRELIIDFYSKKDIELIFK
ncbi:hypothetical protein OAO24_00715 [Methylophilaceae bacterium]|nr:hypothetical protein [Methylophilaceae bacterium]